MLIAKSHMPNFAKQLKPKNLQLTLLSQLLSRLIRISRDIAQIIELRMKSIAVYKHIKGIFINHPLDITRANIHCKNLLP